MNQLLARYIPLCEFLGAMFGAQTEIALHDVEDPAHSLVKLVHPYVSGRREGAPLPDHLAELVEHPDQLGDYRSGYPTKSLDGRTLYSGAYPIREGERIIGFLCVNRDISAFRTLEDALHGLIESYIPGGADDQRQRRLDMVRSQLDTVAAERHMAPAADSIELAVRDACRLLGFEGLDIPVDERLRLLSVLDAQGVFRIKGAVGEVARLLDISEPTIYRGLRSVRRTRQGEGAAE
ncbi:helix-turn-helix transcriptional regulator [Collinsella ihumii]|uniref:Helix-turn-helix transcriptional regulator n=1 Tax=Collinsella ihumii TaxID=1720204 RepID=A0AAW7K0G5_9ACTN|nr:helix-turn-helix transcriptional regulator [Collinsella ihumii]MDN0069116.1 helix-turn-helix transcriptional regulator [Collinsella ihumii]